MALKLLNLTLDLLDVELLLNLLLRLNFLNYTSGGILLRFGRHGFKKHFSLVPVLKHHYWRC